MSGNIQVLWCWPRDNLTLQEDRMPRHRLETGGILLVLKCSHLTVQPATDHTVEPYDKTAHSHSSIVYLVHRVTGAAVTLARWCPITHVTILITKISICHYMHWSKAWMDLLLSCSYKNKTLTVFHFKSHSPDKPPSCDQRAAIAVGGVCESSGGRRRTC